ncbi:hypothetical protein [Prevotella sp.]|uniref:hypothetical protein n=1 Tax=Prevotella sp. TaxID=59823 RepID=UPI0027E2387B|nr:hypothetical protein [Prevotella sp.]
MKKFIVLFVAVMAMFATTAKAQSSLLATLNHEGTISTFYGTNALIQAHAAAADGDVITLSSGTFQSVNITKAVTLRGAGMVLDAATQTEPTVLANEFSINIPDETTQRLTIEGIYTNQKVNIEKLKNAMFLKDRFNIIFAGYRSGQMATDLTFIHCKIAKNYTGANTTYNSASFQNCIVSGIDGYNYIFNNCIIGLGGIHYLCYTSEYKNCVIKTPQSSSNSTTMYNNLYTGSHSLDIPNKTNVRVDEDSEVIKNILVYSDDNDFKLTEEAKALIKGTDGTEVGIYGGNLPFDPTPTNPQISKFNVAAKTTADGKLSVDIEVKSAE